MESGSHGLESPSARGQHIKVLICARYNSCEEATNRTHNLNSVRILLCHVLDHVQYMLAVDVQLRLPLAVACQPWPSACPPENSPFVSLPCRHGVYEQADYKGAHVFCHLVYMA